MYMNGHECMHASVQCSEGSITTIYSGEIFYLPNIYPPITVNAYVHMMHSIQIANFKIHQYYLAAVLPNLMLTKVSRYTVWLKI